MLGGDLGSLLYGDVSVMECRSRPDAAICGIWSGQSLFSLMAVYLNVQNMKKNTNQQIHKIENVLVALIKMGMSILLLWVNEIF